MQLSQWINGHRKTDRILGVLHSGDIVGNGFKAWQWDRFYPFLEDLDSSLFFFPVAGNHDLGVDILSYEAYLPQPFLNAYPDNQKYEGGKALYRVLSVGSDNILLLGVGWNVWKEPEALSWIDQVMFIHAGMPCILVVHGFLVNNIRYYQEVEALIAAHPTIRLVLCGHMDGYYTRNFTYDDDGDGQNERTVTALMLNMQRGRKYAFRLLTFDPLTHSIAVNTFHLDGSPAPDMDKLGPISFVLENAY